MIVGSADGILVVGILDGLILGNTVGAEVMNTSHRACEIQW